VRGGKQQQPVAAKQQESDSKSTPRKYRHCVGSCSLPGGTETLAARLAAARSVELFSLPAWAIGNRPSASAAELKQNLELISAWLLVEGCVAVA
jgi:hypothetical protein